MIKDKKRAHFPFNIPPASHVLDFACAPPSKIISNIKTQYLPYCLKSKSGREMMPFVPLEFIVSLLASCRKLRLLVFFDALI